MHKVIVAHPGKQHSFEMAMALKERGILYKYITTVYDKQGSITRLGKHLLKGNNLRKASSRHCSGLEDDDVLQFDELRSLLLLLISKIPNSIKVWRYFNEKLADSFGRKVAKYAIREEVDAVICYDSNCNTLFNILKKKAPNIKRIMDVSTANRAFLKAEFDAEIDRSKEDALKNEQAHLWDPSKEQRIVNEIADTQYFIVASNFVKKSLLYSDVREPSIYVIPYGVDIEKFNFAQRKVSDKQLKLIYVGQISYKKGLKHLLDVVETFAKDQVQLTLVGAYDIANPLYKKYKNISNIRFLGFVTRESLAEIYKKSDVFVFPTLGEGFGMVVLEAMSCGLPCIVSDHAGGNDVIVNGKNGFEFEAGNDAQLRKSIEWFLKNRQSLPDMSKNARQTAEIYTWEKYRKSVADAILKILSM